jgi:hypothetical protein
MTETGWTSRTKRELMIEVWERLDCESVGAAEIEAVMEAVRGRFGEGAVETPARVARLLADEGASSVTSCVQAGHFIGGIVPASAPRLSEEELTGMDRMSRIKEGGNEIEI